jgi:hypothetical protein
MGSAQQGGQKKTTYIIGRFYRYMKWCHEAKVGQVRKVPCEGLEERDKERRRDGSKDRDVTGGLCETRDLVL